MFPQTALTQLTGIEFPLIQAPMGGGASTPAMIAAVCNAGGLGSLAAAYLSPDAMRQQASEVRANTGKPFNINLFVTVPPTPDAAQIARAMQLLQPIKDELGMPATPVPDKFGEDFQAQFDTLVQLKPAIASFTFGVLDPARVGALKRHGIVVIGTATTANEARAWADAGADMVCAQGSEAGAHRGTFLGSFEAALIGSMALVPQIVDAVSIPVVAAGGIMDGRGIAASLMLGACGAQMGTAFLTCPESGISTAWKEALHGARDDQTLVTRVFSGRYARALINDFTNRLGPVEAELPPFPIQNTLTVGIRQAAGKANRPGFQSLFAGQAASMCRSLPAAELVAALMKETETALRGAAV
jgi:nitronate monooxygenase